jgi:hypothetical protein
MKYGGGTGTFTAGPTIQGFTSNRHHCPSDGLTGINLTGTIPFFYLSAFFKPSAPSGGNVGAARTPL